MNILKIVSYLTFVLVITNLLISQTYAQDSDGDGWTDTEETNAGSDAQDKSSFPKTLRSPAYSIWNGFIEMTNIVELVNTEGVQSVAKLSLFKIDGSLGGSQDIVIPPYGQFDVILNDFPGFSRNSYGVIKIEFDTNITGQVVYYQRGILPERAEFADFGSSGEFINFALPLHLTNPTRGDSTVLFNTFPLKFLDNIYGDLTRTINPSHMSNWLSIINLSEKTEKYLVESYDQSGNLIISRELELPAFGRQDLDGGHGLLGQSAVGSHKIRPADESHPYLAYNTRYSYDVVAQRMRAAYSVRSVLGTTKPLVTFIGSNLDRNYNYLEIQNTSSNVAEVSVKFYPASEHPDRPHLFSVSIDERNYSIPPFGQIHIERNSAGIDDLSSRPVVIQSTNNQPIVAQAAYYNDDRYSPNIDTLTISTAQQILGSSFYFSYNTYLSQVNCFTLVNTSSIDSEIVTAHVTYSLPDQTSISKIWHIGGKRSFFDCPFHDSIVGLGYGVVGVKIDKPHLVVPYVTRVKQDIQYSFGTYDEGYILYSRQYLMSTNVLTK